MGLKKFQSLAAWLPEIYFIAFWLIADIFNPISITFIVLLSLQILIKNKVAGIMLSGLFILINLYLILALLSEFSEFPTFTAKAKKLITFGSILIGVNLTMATIMLIKYLKTKIPTLQTSI